MGQIANSITTGGVAYLLKVQSMYVSGLSITIRFEQTYQLSTESGTVALSFWCRSLCCSDVPTGNKYSEDCIHVH